MTSQDSGGDDWTGREETVSTEVAPVQAAMLAAALDRAASPGRGEPLPPLWHWLAGVPTVRQSELGEDGHPRRGGFLPPIALPRRMWAGSELAFPGPLVVGETLRRISTIESVTAKTGSSGQLVFVRVRHEVHAVSGVAVVEHQDIVYREASSPAPSPDSPHPLDGFDWVEEVLPSSALLFRYSAATFNAHRIHYDRDYAVGVEGYAGLVVQGPLTATLLMEALTRRVGGAVRRFAFRGMRPLFCDCPIMLCGRAGEPAGHHELLALDDRGNVAMRASAVIA